MSIDAGAQVVIILLSCGPGEVIVIVWDRLRAFYLFVCRILFPSVGITSV